MATRLQGTYYSTIHGHQFDIDIDDSDYASSASDFTILDLSFNWRGINEQRMNPIMTSAVDVVINVDSSTLNSFISDLVGAEEERFTIKIQKNSSLYWVGVVLVDEIRKQDRPYNSGYSFTLSATDGIGRLKDVDYNNAGTAYTGKEPIMDHLFNVLGKIGLDSYWGASDIYLTSVVNWWENSQTFANATDPLTITRFDHRALIKLDRSGNSEYLSAFEVLEMICRQWGARFFHSGGRYYLIQTNEYAQTGTVVLRHFVKAGTYDSNTTDSSFASTDKTWGDADEYDGGSGSADLVGLAPGEFSYFPPLHHVTIDYKHSSIQNIAANAAWDQDTQTTYTIESVDSNSQTAKIAFRFNLTYSVSYINSAEFIPLRFKFRFLLSIDDGGGTIYYLKRTANVGSNGGVVFGNASWTTTESYFEFFSDLLIADSIDSYTSFNFTTPALPQDGELDAQLDYFQAYNAFGYSLQSGQDFIEYWSATGFYLEVLIDGSLESQSNVTRYRVDNTDATTNTAVIELETRLGDGPTGNALGHLEVSDGADWTNSTLWRVGSSGDYDFSFNELLAREILSGQITPVLKWNGTVRGDIEIYSTLVRDSLNLIALGAKYDAGRDEWDGEWFKISTNPTPISVADSEEWIDPPNFGEGFEPTDPTAAAPSQTLPPNPDGRILDPGLASPSYPDIYVAESDEAFTQGDVVNDFDVTATNEEELYFEDDTVIMVDPLTGQQQSMTIGASVDHASGETNVSVDETSATANFPTGSPIIADPIEQQANIQWGRRKFLHFPLVDYDTDLTSSASYVTLNANFFRPPAATTTSGWELVDNKYIKRIYLAVGQAVSGSVLVSYTFQMLEGGATQVLGPINFNGATVRSSIGGSLHLLQDDIYTFQLKRNDVSGLSSSKGLNVIVEIINKAFQPDDIDGLTLWLRSDADVYSDAGSTNCTDGDTVQEWHDQTSNGNDASQGVAANKPTWNIGGQNGWPYISFDGINDRLGCGDTTTFVFLHETGGTVFIVAQYGETDDPNDIYSIIANTNNSATDVGFAIVYDDQDSNHYENRLNTFVVNGTGGQQVVSNISDNDAVIANVCNINTIVLDPDNGTAADRSDTYINEGSAIGNNADTDTASSANATRAIQIGSNGIGGNPLAGRIYEILIYNTVLSDTNRNKVYRYLDRKYRVNNATAFNPQQIAGLQLWLKADEGVYNDAGTTLATDGQTVQEWHDWSGNNNDFTQTTGASKPTWSTNTVNGYPVVTFDGSATQMLASDFIGTNDITLFIVAKSDNASPVNETILRQGYTSGTSVSMAAFLSSTNFSFSCVDNTSTGYTDSTPLSTGFAVYSGAYSSNSSIIEVHTNGDSNGTTATGGNPLFASSVDVVLGARPTSDLTTPATFDRHFDGGVAEVLIYNSSLSDSNREKVERYLANKYGITIS